MSRQSVSKGNFISEWFGQRIYPVVRIDSTKFPGAHYDICPFLTPVLSAPTKCIKNDNSIGVCSINAMSNGPRQDWLACPYRVIDSKIVTQACEKIFGKKPPKAPTPVSLLRNSERLNQLKGHIQEDGFGYVFFQDKLGGEISILGTAQSPEMSFDITIVEIRYVKGRFLLGRYGILEVQTMDFHGSYKKAVSNLRDAARLHKGKFATSLRDNPKWASDGIEGPNIANVFKRTFYQIMLKFELGGRGAAAGTVLAIPQSVWDSWQSFLGAPTITHVSGSTYRIGDSGTEIDPASSPPNAHICVFDLDADADASISPVRVNQFISVSPDQLAHSAFQIVPENMIQALQGRDSILESARTRLVRLWPDLQGPEGAKTIPSKKRKRDRN